MGNMPLRGKIGHVMEGMLFVYLVLKTEPISLLASTAHTTPDKDGKRLGKKKKKVNTGKR